MDEVEEKDSNVMLKVCTFIVDKRNLFFLIFIIALIFSAFSRNWVKIENSLTAYLPENSTTSQGLKVMDSEFITYGSAQVMIANISYAQADALLQEIKQMNGVLSVEFDNTTSHYNNASALFNITFDYDEDDDKCLDALNSLKNSLSFYDMYISTDLGDATSQTIASEMGVIQVLVAGIVVAVLFLTSGTFAEVPVLLLTFGAAAILGMGTNYMLGTISFVSNSVTVVLQLALSVDYAVIYSNRFKEEHISLPIREAAIMALYKSIPVILASSMTVIGGLAAMTFMQFKIGPDMGIVLIKAIILSLLAIFLIMPGLLVLFGKLIEKSGHKILIPQIPVVGRFAYRTRKIIPPVFLIIIAVSFYFSSHSNYVFGYSKLVTPVLNDTQIASQMINDTFGTSNKVALVVPAGDYDTEAKLLTEIESFKEVDSTMGLANINAMGDYNLTDKLTPRQFAELTNLDYDEVQALYTAYAAENDSYGKIVGGISTYSVALIDMFTFVYKEVQEGYVKLDDEMQKTLDDAYTQINMAKAQLQGKNYSRMLVNLNLPQEGEETFAFLDKMQSIAEQYYPNGSIYVVGNATSQYDLSKTFERDDKVVTIMSILIVLVVLLFMFKSAGMPILLIIIIQGSIWVNFAIPAITGSYLFFMSYLIVSSIQMGANIDYAIVLTDRYEEFKKEMSPKDAMINALNLAFPTVITSGTMLAAAGALIGQMTSDAAIVGIGQSLGRGTLISMLVVLFVLPQTLLLGDKIVEKTSFTVGTPIKMHSMKGMVWMNGRIHGYVNGRIDGTVRAMLSGNVNAIVETGDIKQLPDDEADCQHIDNVDNSNNSEHAAKPSASESAEDANEKK